MDRIVHLVDIQTPPEPVFQALTTQAGLAKWWTTQVRLQAEEVGSLVQFRFTPQFNPEMEIGALEGNRRVEWRCSGGAQDWGDSRIRFDMRTTPQGTRLLFEHRFAHSLPDELYGIFNYNWAYYLESLRTLCETGKGKPFQP